MRSVNWFLRVRHFPKRTCDWLVGSSGLRRAGPTAAAIMLLALSACTSNTPINSFCAWFVPTDFVDPGLLKLSPDNKRVQIVNETTRLRECAAESSGLKAGPK